MFYYKNLNGFDERYFMYLEDVDLCRRALQLTKIYYCPETTIVHVFNKGSYKSKLLLWYHIRSAITYFNKWGWFFDKKDMRIIISIYEISQKS
jgi:GT2 family glycosyltransferase